MATTWVIDLDSDRKNRERLGDDEFDRRVVCADKHRDALDEKGKWEEAMVLHPQFQSIAMQLNQKQFDVAENWATWKWVKFVYKLAGVKA